MILQDDKLMDTEEVARYLNVHPKTVMNLVERGDLKAYKVGRNWRYRRSDVEDYLEQRQHGSRDEDR